MGTLGKHSKSTRKLSKGEPHFRLTFDLMKKPKVSPFSRSTFATVLIGPNPDVFFGNLGCYVRSCNLFG